jgi:hypothetical protein
MFALDPKPWSTWNLLPSMGSRMPPRLSGGFASMKYTFPPSWPWSSASRTVGDNRAIWKLWTVRCSCTACHWYPAEGFAHSSDQPTGYRTFA